MAGERDHGIVGADGWGKSREDLNAHGDGQSGGGPIHRPQSGPRRRRYALQAEGDGPNRATVLRLRASRLQSSLAPTGILSQEAHERSEDSSEQTRGQPLSGVIPLGESGPQDGPNRRWGHAGPERAASAGAIDRRSRGRSGRARRTAGGRPSSPTGGPTPRRAGTRPHGSGCPPGRRPRAEGRSRRPAAAAGRRRRPRPAADVQQVAPDRLLSRPLEPAQARERFAGRVALPLAALSVPLEERIQRGPSCEPHVDHPLPRGSGLVSMTRPSTGSIPAGSPCRLSRIEYRPAARHRRGPPRPRH